MPASARTQSPGGADCTDPWRVVLGRHAASGPPLTAEEAERSVTNYVRSWVVYPVGSTAVLEAIRGVQRYQFAYWDALIWATASLAAY